MAAEHIAELVTIDTDQDRHHRLRELIDATGLTLMELAGIGPSGAARLLGDVGDIGRFAGKGRFASSNGTAPLDASSGDQNRHRLSRAGNRRINLTLHIMALTALRHGGQARAYYDRRVAAGQDNTEAMRCLKRRLSNIVYARVKAGVRRLANTALDTSADTAAAGPGGRPGATRQSSAAESHPDIDTSDQSLPGPATDHPRTGPRRRVLTQRGAMSGRSAATRSAAMSG